MDSRTAEESIFTRAIEISSPQERDNYLDEACGDDSKLRSRLEVLLAEHEQPDALLDDGGLVVDQIINSPSELPKQFGEFDIIREIGRGGMGVVYEAHQTSLNRRVALKVLSVGLGFSDKAIARFKREAEAAARLHHSNIVPIHSTGSTDNLPFYSMELVQGPSLELVIALLKNESSGGGEANLASLFARPDLGTREVTGPAENSEDAGECPQSTVSDSFVETMSITSSLGTGTTYFDNAARLIADVADALTHAHREGIIHRDIKPANLLFSREGRLCITDFGLARMLEAPSVTMTGEVLGSPRYMSPEQIALNASQLDHRTDIYSLGVTLYELLTLQPAFPSSRRDQVLTQVLHTEPPSPRQLNGQIPVDLETICKKSIEKSPDDRYQNTEEMAEDLRRFVRHHAISARRIGPLGRAWRWCRRNRALAIVSMLLFICLLAGASVFGWQQISRAREESQQLRHLIQEIRFLRENNSVWDSTVKLYAAMQEYPQQPDLRELWRELPREITIHPDADGCNIEIRPAKGDDNVWLHLGSTPKAIRLPDENFHLRLTRNGHVRSVTLQSTLDWTKHTWSILMPTRTDMVRIQSTEAENRLIAQARNSHHTRVFLAEKDRIPWLQYRKIPDLPEFQIDRHEVTNAQFAEFVRSEDYFRQDLWKPLLGANWKSITKEQFVDTNGNYGPAFWPYRSEEEHHPVVGVSWYEAMAYAKWKNKNLPTLFHWLRAAEYDGIYDSVDLTGRNNTNYRLAEPRECADHFLSVNRHGVFDLEGNVREWCLNEQDKRKHYAMGSSWRDPSGAKFSPVSYSAMDRRADTGFRCADYEVDNKLTVPLPIRWRESPPQKIAIGKFRSDFSYNPTTAWNASAPEETILSDVEVIRVSFDAAYSTEYQNERITCYLALPDQSNFQPPFQVVVAATPIFESTTGTPQPGYFTHYQKLVNSGRAVVFPSIYGMSFSRPTDEWLSEYPDPKNLNAFKQGVIRRAQDFSRTLDYIHTFGNQFELDKDRIAYCGSQLDCIYWMVADHAFVQPNRIKAAILPNIGIANFDQPPEVDQLTFLPHFQIPSLVLANLQKLDRPYDLQRRMFEELPVPLTQKRFEEVPQATWGFPLDKFDKWANDWLDKWLTKPRRTTHGVDTTSQK